MKKQRWIINATPRPAQCCNLCFTNSSIKLLPYHAPMTSPSSEVKVKFESFQCHIRSSHYMPRPLFFHCFHLSILSRGSLRDRTLWPLKKPWKQIMLCLRKCGYREVSNLQRSSLLKSSTTKPVRLEYTSFLPRHSYSHMSTENLATIFFHSYNKLEQY